MKARQIIERETLLEGFREKRDQFVRAGADAQEVESAIAKFKDLKSRHILKQDELDIDRYQTFDQLKSVIQQVSQRTTKSGTEAAAKKDVDVVHDDKDIKIVVPKTAEACQVYGKHTKWCITDPATFRYYREVWKVKHYICIRKSYPQSYFSHKVCLTVYPDGYMTAHDGLDMRMTLSQFRDVTGLDPKKFAPNPQDMPEGYSRWNIYWRESYGVAADAAESHKEYLEQLREWAKLDGLSVGSLEEFTRSVLKMTLPEWVEFGGRLKCLRKKFYEGGAQFN